MVRWVTCCNVLCVLFTETILLKLLETLGGFGRKGLGAPRICFHPLAVRLRVYYVLLVTCSSLVRRQKEGLGEKTRELVSGSMPSSTLTATRLLSFQSPSAQHIRCQGEDSCFYYCSLVSRLSLQLDQINRPL